jgi:hypothetical protein
MTFAIGRRFIIVDGTERWRDADVEQQLAPLLADLPPETTVAFFAREEGRAKAPAALHAAIRRAGGDISEEAGVKDWDLPKWAQAHARRWASSSTSRRQRRSSRWSGRVSSGWRASWRSSRSSAARARGSTPKRCSR